MAKTKSNAQSSRNEVIGATLSHDEVWDDSALIDSWDAALHEYKKYHSLHARGLTVTESLQKYDAALANGAEHADAVSAAFAQADEDMVEAGDLEDVEHNHTSSNTQGNTESHPDGVMANQSMADHTGAGLDLGSGNPGTNDIPASLLNGPAGPATQDAGLRNLLMSWYYAGYYTGLHEGQQRSLGQDRSNLQNGPT